jgi:hypothetical protein
MQQGYLTGSRKTIIPAVYPVLGLHESRPDDDEMPYSITRPIIEYDEEADDIAVKDGIRMLALLFEPGVPEIEIDVDSFHAEVIQDILQ